MLNVPLNILLLSLIWCSLSVADISEGVKSWLKEQGCVIKADFHFTPVITEDLKKGDIVEFDQKGENTYGIVFADPDPGSGLVAVDVAGMATQMVVIVGIQKTDIKGAVRVEKGNSAFLGPIHPHHLAVTLPWKPIAFGMPTHPYSQYGFPHRRNA